MLAKRRDELKNKRDQLRQDLDDAVKKCVDVKDPRKQVMANVLILLEAVKEIVFELELNPLETAVVSRAELIRQANERLYDACTYTFWVLSVAGWGIGLIGLYNGRKNSGE